MIVWHWRLPEGLGRVESPGQGAPFHLTKNRFPFHDDYTPTEAWYDKTWPLDELEVVE